MRKIKALSLFFLFFPLFVHAQIGEHRNIFSVGFNGGYSLSSVHFTPKVSQGMHSGATGGVSVRYTCEKYFNTICSIMGEINYNVLGWKQDILDVSDQPVVNQETGLPEEYSRTVKYIQVPLLAHLAWGKEQRGFSFFFHGGPQIGFCQSETTKTNYSLEQRNIDARANTIVAQEAMPVKNKFDYGITGGIGAEYSVPKFGHILLEARYYYGLGNIYPDSSADQFGSSNFQNIQVKATYMFDL